MSLHYHTMHWKRRWLMLAGVLLASTSLFAAEVEIFSESFETDGSGVRYLVENEGDDGSNDYFGRRELGSAGTRVRGAIDGTIMWSIRDIDSNNADPSPESGLESDEGTITWTQAIDITGLGNFVIKVLAAQGADEQEWDNAMNFQVRFDGGDWVSVGGFRGLFTDAPSFYFQGDLRTFPDFGDPRLTSTFKEWEWNVYGTGSTLEIRMYTNMNGGAEENHFDFLRILADDAVQLANFSLNKETFAENEGAGAGTITVTLPAAAPAGGVRFVVTSTDTDGDEVSLPSSITVPEGETQVVAPFSIIADGRFDGDELVIVRFDAPGYARDEVRFTVTNLDAKPNVIINEFLPVLNNVDPELLQFDATGDGRVNENEEQFIEIINLENFPVDMTGWTVNDELQVRHFFPDGTVLEPGGVLVVFSSPNYRGVFGGAQVQFSNLRTINFDEDGDIAQLVADGALVDSFPYGGDIGETFDSIARNPDITGGFVDHSTIAEAGGALWSPGTKVDGTPFYNFIGELTLDFGAETVVEGNTLQGTVTSSVAAPAGGFVVVLDNPDSTEVSMPATVTIPEGQTTVNFTLSAIDDLMLDGDYDLELFARHPDLLPAVFYLEVTNVNADPYNVVINEAMGDILGTNGDFNQNGIVEEPVEDQFIEIVNNGAERVDLSHWFLESWRTSKPGGPQVVHVFPATTILEPGGSIVVFGIDPSDEAALQAQSAAFFGGAPVQAANSHGNGVNVTVGGQDGIITLYGPNGHIEDEVEFLDDITEQAQAIVRSPDVTGDFAFTHLNESSALELASPGRKLDGTAFAGNGIVTGLLSPRGFFTDTMEISTDGWWFGKAGWVNADFETFPWMYFLGTNGWYYALGSSEDFYRIWDNNLGQFGFTGVGLYPYYWADPDYVNFVNLLGQ